MRRTTLEVIDAYVGLARPIMVDFLGRQSCIASTRITQEVMARFGIQAEPVPCKLVAQCDALELAYVAGFDERECVDMAKSARSFTDRREHAEDPGWPGHLVSVVADRFWIDTSLDQMHSPEFNFEIPHEILALPVDPKIPVNDLDIEAVIEIGNHVVKLRYTPSDDFTFLLAPAWEYDAAMRLIVEVIVAAIVDELHA